MKKTLTLVIALAIAGCGVAFANGPQHVFTLGDNAVGIYAGGGMRYSTVNGDPAGFLDIKGALVFNGTWAFGVVGSSLYYDKALSALTSDGTYHLNVAYGAVFAERIFDVNNDCTISIALLLGQGEAYYRYDNEYREEKVWTEETIDRTTFAVIEPTVEIQHRIAENLWLGASAGYRSTSPLRLLGASDTMLQRFSGGLTLKWGIF